MKWQACRVLVDRVQELRPMTLDYLEIGILPFDLHLLYDVA